MEVQVVCIQSNLRTHKHVHTRMRAQSCMKHGPLTGSKRRRVKASSLRSNHSIRDRRDDCARQRGLGIIWTEVRVVLVGKGRGASEIVVTAPSARAALYGKDLSAFAPCFGIIGAAVQVCVQYVRGCASERGCVCERVCMREGVYVKFRRSQALTSDVGIVGLRVYFTLIVCVSWYLCVRMFVSFSCAFV